jgi:hypothetical protein
MTTEVNQSILALSKVLAAALGLLRLLASFGLMLRLYLACFLSFLRATITGTEDLVTR